MLKGGEFYFLLSSFYLQIVSFLKDFLDSYDKASRKARSYFVIHHPTQWLLPGSSILVDPHCSQKQTGLQLAVFRLEQGLGKSRFQLGPLHLRLIQTSCVFRLWLEQNVVVQKIRKYPIYVETQLSAIAANGKCSLSEIAFSQLTYRGSTFSGLTSIVRIAKPKQQHFFR